MAKRRSIGVALWGWYFVLGSITAFLANIGFLKDALTQGSGSYGLFPVLLALFCVFNFFIGLNILRLRELWRKITLAYGVLSAFSTLAAIPILKCRTGVEIAALSFLAVISVSLLFFFTRPEVRKQYQSH